MISKSTGLISWSRSNPFFSGMAISRKTSSGFNFSIFSLASSALLHNPTISNSGQFISSNFCNADKPLGSSSTSTVFIFFILLLFQGVTAMWPGCRFRYSPGYLFCLWCWCAHAGYISHWAKRPCFGCWLSLPADGRHHSPSRDLSAGYQHHCRQFCRRGCHHL